MGTLHKNRYLLNTDNLGKLLVQLYYSLVIQALTPNKVTKQAFTAPRLKIIIPHLKMNFEPSKGYK